MQAQKKHMASLVSLLLTVSTPIAAQETPAVTQLSIEDNGRALQLGVGQTISIKLPAQPGTGHSWIVTMSPFLSLIKTEFVGKSLPGGKQFQLLTFRADAAGVGSVVLVYRRPWERPDAAAGHFSITLTIKAN
ncbi:MAG: protease inhibitor I42 family protein [Rhodomicrobium sp.]